MRTVFWYFGRWATVSSGGWVDGAPFGFMGQTKQ